MQYIFAEIEILSLSTFSFYINLVNVIMCHIYLKSFSSNQWLISKYGIRKFLYNKNWNENTYCVNDLSSIYFYREYTKFKKFYCSLILFYTISKELKVKFDKRLFSISVHYMFCSTLLTKRNCCFIFMIMFKKKMLIRFPFKSKIDI